MTIRETERERGRGSLTFDAPFRSNPFFRLRAARGAGDFKLRMLAERLDGQENGQVWMEVVYVGDENGPGEAQNGDEEGEEATETASPMSVPQILLPDFTVSVDPAWPRPTNMLNLLVKRMAELRKGGFAFRLDLDGNALATDVIVRVLFFDADVINSPQVSYKLNGQNGTLPSRPRRSCLSGPTKAFAVTTSLPA